MSIYSLTRQDLVEIAADILQCSMERIRVRCRMSKAGSPVEAKNNMVYCAINVPNPYTNVVPSAGNTYTLHTKQDYTYFYLFNNSVCVPSDGCFFFQLCRIVNEPFVYLEFERF